MPESSVIHNDELPLTVDALAEQFAACGLAAGQTVVVHSSMSKIGWIVGGAQTVIRALLQVLTPDGTLMMPTHTSGNTDPGHWEAPPVPESWWSIIRENMPVYDPQISVTREMGQIPELFRTWPGALRSGHPITSFAALGPQAAYATESHRLDDEFGDDSPLGKLYALNGHVLLLGVRHGNNTSLHVAEARATFAGKSFLREGTAMLVNGERQWVNFDRMEPNTDDFDSIGAAYEAQHRIPIYKVGNADVRLIKQRSLVDFAVEWMQIYR